MMITRIDMISAGKILGIMYAGMGLLLGGVLSIAALAGAVANRGNFGAAAFGVGAVIFLPLLYGILGFIGGVIGALIYNLAASFVGGIEMEVEYRNLPYATQPANHGDDSPFIME